MQKKTIKPTTRAAVLRALRKADIAVSNSHATRIRGWHSWMEGVNVSNVSPFSETFTHKGRRHVFYSEQEVHEATISYRNSSNISSKFDGKKAKEVMAFVGKVLEESGIEFRVEGENLFVFAVENPFVSGEERRRFCCERYPKGH